MTAGILLSAGIKKDTMMKQKLIRTVILVFLAAVLPVCACLPVFAAGTDSPEALVRRIIRSYVYDNRRNKKALAELAEKGPALKDQWERILDLWEEPVRVNRQLPDGLPEDDTLCLVALGYQLNPDGTMRPELVERMKVVLEAACQYPNAVIICTGGPTASGHPDATEAGRMSEWLIQNGVDPDRVIAESRSLNTAENAIFTFDILEERFPQVTQIAIISSDYHIATGVLLFGAEAILRDLPVTVVSNAAWKAPSGSLSRSAQGNMLLQLYLKLETDGT